MASISTPLPSSTPSYRELAVRSEVALLLALAVTAFGRGARAQTEEVTVRGDAAGNFSSRADERDAAREVTDAASLVEPLPGVHVRRYGADDSFTTLSIRGSSSTEISIVFAGVPLTGGADPSLDLATLPLWPGAVARVHRTFAPASLGPGSLGGTLVLDPPSPTLPPSTETWAAIGSYGEARLRAADVRSAGGGSRVVTAISASRADDDFSYLDPTATTPGHDVYSTRQNAGHAAVNGLVSWVLPVRGAGESTGALTVTTLAQARHQELPGTVLGPTPFAELDSDRELASAQLTLGAGRGTWIVRGWVRLESLRLSDSAASAALGPTRADQLIAATGGSMGWRGRPIASTTVELRVDGSVEHFEPGDIVGALEPPGATRVSAGAALDAEWREAEHLTWAASARLDDWSNLPSGDPSASTSGELRPTGHLGVELPLGDLILAAHGGATGRPPSFVELYGDRGAFLGDPNLRPESAWTLDAGARLSRPIGPVRFAAEVAGFATWARDLITFVPVGAYGRSEATNIGLARLFGAEVDARATVGPVEMRASYTGLSTENDAACVAAVGPCIRPALPGRPSNDLVADVIVTLGEASVRGGVDAVSGMVADDAGSILVPPRVLASFGARLEVTRELRLALDVRNLLDVRTSTYEGAIGPVHEPIGDYFEYPLPGRTLLVSARYAVGSR
jgi:outer membrane receptor protein involved in Fe transport